LVGDTEGGGKKVSPSSKEGKKRKKVFRPARKGAKGLHFRGRGDIPPKEEKKSQWLTGKNRIHGAQGEGIELYEKGEKKRDLTEKKSEPRRHDAGRKKGKKNAPSRLRKEKKRGKKKRGGLPGGARR